MFLLLSVLAAQCAFALSKATPVLKDVSAEKRSTCTFTSYSQAMASQSACSSIVLSNIAVPAGETLALTKLQSGATVTFSGTTSFGYKEWDGPLISVAGSGLTITGSRGHVIDGNGSRWWDGHGSNTGGKTKPNMIAVEKAQHSTFSGLNIKDTPVQCFSIDNSNFVNFLGITINDSNGGDDALAANTDAFDVASSSSIYISGATVTNQDDCLAINSGTNITFTGGTCTGGHGLSIGSVGGRSDNTVQDVYITSNQIVNSQNGVRVKTISGATGKVANVHYQDITLSGISKYGVVIQQDYENGKPDGPVTNGVSISGLVLDNVHGSVSSSGTDVLIACGSGSCTGWTWNKVSVTGGRKSTSCENVPKPASC